MFKLIFSILLLSSVAYGQSLEGMLKTALAPEHLLCPPEATANDCARDLCGPASSTPSMVLTNSSFQSKASEIVKDKDKKLKEIETKMRSYLLSHNENVKKLKPILKSDFPKIDFRKWNEFELFQAEYDVFKQYITFSADHSKPLNDRLTMNIRTPDWMTEEDKNVLTAYAEKEKASYGKDADRLIRDEFYTIPELKNVINELWKEVSLKPLNEVVRKELQKKVQNLDTHEIDLGLIYRNLATIKRSHDTTPVKVDLKCVDSECHKVMSKVLEKMYAKSFKSFAENLEPLKVSDVFIQNRAKTCLANVIAKEELNQRGEAFEKNLPEVIDTFINKSMKDFSPHSKKVFLDILKNEVNFNFKSTKPLSLGDRLNSINVKTHPEKKLKAISEVVMDPFSHMEECSNLSPKKDQVIEIDDKLELQLSYFSCSHEGEGKQILAHEIAHILSYSVSKGRLSSESKNHFNEQRECVSSRHNYHSGRSIYSFAQNTDHLHSEEDHADTMAQIAYPDGTFYSCSLLDRSWDGSDYQVSIAKTQSSHSNPLLRLMWEASSKKKKLPKSCDDIFKNQTDYDFKSCIDLE